VDAFVQSTDKNLMVPVLMFVRQHGVNAGPKDYFVIVIVVVVVVVIRLVHLAIL
jgi:hypothetical protein